MVSTSATPLQMSSLWMRRYPRFSMPKPRILQFPRCEKCDLGHRRRNFDRSNLPPNGTLIHDAEVILPGTKALAQQVAVEMKEAFNLDFSPNLADIMDAIQRGDCIYGTDRLDFSHIYQSACEKWVESARAEIRSKWTQHLPQLGEVLVVGGSANLALPSVKHQAIASGLHLILNCSTSLQWHI
jgi:hypothetical protein